MKKTMKHTPLNPPQPALKIILLIPLLLSFLSACAIHYKNVPGVAPASAAYAVTEKVLYKVNTLPVFSADGLDAVAAAFQASPALRNAECYYAEAIPPKGLFILAKTQYQTPDIAAAAFGYLSASTLTLLPVWSNHNGFNLFYRIYRIKGSVLLICKYYLALTPYGLVEN